VRKKFSRTTQSHDRKRRTPQKNKKHEEKEEAIGLFRKDDLAAAHG